MLQSWGQRYKDTTQDLRSYKQIKWSQEVSKWNQAGLPGAGHQKLNAAASQGTSGETIWKKAKKWESLKSELQGLWDGSVGKSMPKSLTMCSSPGWREKTSKGCPLTSNEAPSYMCPHIYVLQTHTHTPRKYAKRITTEYAIYTLKSSPEEKPKWVSDFCRKAFLIFGPESHGLFISVLFPWSRTGLGMAHLLSNVAEF